MHDATVQTSGIGVPFRCPRCQHDLRPMDHSVDCLGCKSSWPIEDGIPRFDTAAHFGEAAAEKMTALTRSAAAGHWEEATRRHFGADVKSLYPYIADLNRASWISLLPIPASATVLDIGAGLGAITHALALTYRRVVAVEPVRERLEFIRVRAQQEALHNVQLVQTTAALLPFAPGTFDLVVVNGVLEWVGEWDQSVSPRKAQLRFMRRLRELLAPNGVVVIGIENRLSLSSLGGLPDHNGLRFTNLMPRAVATTYMKLRGSRSHRMNLNARREYRTYTYTRAGYRRLLVEAGYRTTEFWWPDPGYNEPYFLCPLADTAEIHSYLKKAQQEIQCLNGRSLQGVLKDWLVVRTGLFPAMAPDFVIIARGHEDGAQEEPHRDTSIVGTVLDALKEHAFAGPFHVSSLTSSQLGNKQTLKVAERDGTLAAVAKIARVDATTATGVENGFAHLSSVWNVVGRTDPGFLASLPEPLGLLHVAGRVVSLERAVRGVSLEQLSMDPSFLRDRNRVRRHLKLITDWIIRFQRSASSHLRDVVPRSARPEWMMSAGEPGEPRDLPTVQHGDLFPGNIFVDDAHGRVSVIDWDGLAVGYPPLFDYFCAVTQLVHPPRRSWRSRRVVPYDEFLAFAFCEVNWFSALVLEWAKVTCSALGFQASNLPGYFLQHLAVRHRQQSERGAALAPALDSLHRRILEGSTRSIFE